MSISKNWYPDPADPENNVRWWDGEKWSNHVQPKHPQQPSQQAPEQNPTSFTPQLEEQQQQAPEVAPIPRPSISPEYADYPEYAVEEPREESRDDYQHIIDNTNALTADEEAELENAETHFGERLAPKSITPFTVKQLKKQYKRGDISKSQYRIQRKEALSRMSNTRFTSIGGWAFSIYLLAYPAVVAAGIYYLGLSITEVGTSIASIDFTTDPAGSVTTIQNLMDLGPRYQAFRMSFIISVIASAGIPFLLGFIGAFSKKGRVWSVATILLSLFFNPAILMFGALTNLSWVVVLFG